MAGFPKAQLGAQLAATAAKNGVGILPTDITGYHFQRAADGTVLIDAALQRDGTPVPFTDTAVGGPKGGGTP